ncbi:hypothetical protein AJ80_02708 [Polytolypa hystricis UAMH7299]|uniref:Cell cycle inhibitor Nif1 n=1 Tax=Polytolypa hystricis (strain UAMH7299) TaxID=1447883 RepID=A0A2B7YR08_POLH7|nr:hypothetical protein AJ80_02708 [Polytolypa hystricis UAMH7299]
MALEDQSGTPRPRTANLAPSPRVEHFDGEVPPALSPLDAFALQGRLLAKQLDESRKGNRRLSRLAPASVARSLSQPRPGYFRAPSSGDSAKPPPSPSSWDRGIGTTVEEPKFRPQSQHPRLSGIPRSSVPFNRDSESELPPLESSPDNYFDIPRADSPEESSWLNFNSDEDHKGPETGPPVGIGIQGVRRQESSGDSPSRPPVPNTLAPPSASSLRPAGSPGLAHLESSDDDYYTSSNAGSTFSKPRKLSSSSGMSMPHSPMSQISRPRPRSPSPTVELMNSQNPLPRPSFNFSRPLSRSSTSPSLSSIMLAPSELRTEPRSRTMNRGNRPAPIDLEAPSRLAADTAEGDLHSPAPSYIYAKYSLPRGREVARDSIVFSGLQTPLFEWSEPLFESTPPPSATYDNRPARTPSPPAAPQRELSASPAAASKPHPPRTSTAKSISTRDPSPPMPVRHSFDQGTNEVLSVRNSNSHNEMSAALKPGARLDAKASPASSASTVRPHTSRSAKSGSPIPQNTAEYHVAKGIECHENGSLNESTYHLRIAAMQNDPTGMLLYALACRHGWGMRANPTEGVKWLRKAMDSAGLDVTDYDNAAMEPRGRNIQDQKALRAQFALSVYELGVSHLNGWGIDQDKALALRCFEIAGQWGDVDALAEAGYCYAEGIGCKKNLKKAAKLYRAAESKGMSMVGNSWIYKDKYMSDDATASRSRTSASEKKPRNKSRTRSIFGRKKSTPTSSGHHES